jgi:hypothetical protein
MSDEMINKTKAFNKSSGTQGIGDTVTLMDKYDMNNLSDTIGAGQKAEFQEVEIRKYNKNS